MQRYESCHTISQSYTLAHTLTSFPGLAFSPQHLLVVLHASDNAGVRRHGYKASMVYVDTNNCRTYWYVLSKLVLPLPTMSLNCLPEMRVVAHFLATRSTSAMPSTQQPRVKQSWVRTSSSTWIARPGGRE